jgi:V-type H+-transporting ATPase subunit D
LKKVSGKKQRDQAVADAEQAKQRQKDRAEENGESTAEAQDVLGENEDNDVIF